MYVCRIVCVELSVFVCYLSCFCFSVCVEASLRILSHLSVTWIVWSLSLSLSLSLALSLLCVCVCVCVYMQATSSSPLALTRMLPGLFPSFSCCSDMFDAVLTFVGSFERCVFVCVCVVCVCVCVCTCVHACDPGDQRKVGGWNMIVVGEHLEGMCMGMLHL